MAGKRPPLCAGETYHLYNRGVNRQPIFFRRENWGFFLVTMRRYFLPELVDVLAYCLMPNHYHLLATLHTDDFSDEVAQPFGTSYVKAVNKQQQRVGPLFQGPFKARRINSASYFAEITRYIHLNPVRAGLVERPEEWPWSSYNDYIGLRHGTLPRTAVVLDSFPSRQAYREFVEAGDADDVEVRLFGKA